METKESIKEITKVVAEWQSQDDENRAAIVITLQKTGGDDDHIEGDAGCVVAGKHGDLVVALKGALLNHGDKTLAKLIKEATQQIMLEKLIHDLKNANE